MNKSELVKSVAKMAQVTNSEAESVVNAFIEVVSEALKKGDKVQLVGFGSFQTVKRSARTGVNPKTKEKIQIPAKKVPKFNPGKELRELVNKTK